MTFSNRDGFHYMQILQNATALQAYIYRETNNKTRINRKRHALSKQYWRKKHWLAENDPARGNQAQPTRPTRPTRPKPTQQDTRQQSTTASHDTQDFIQSPFPEKRAPIIINSQAKRKPTVNSNASPTKRHPNKTTHPTAQAPLKPKRTPQETSPIADKWLRAKQEKTTAKSASSNVRANRHKKITPPSIEIPNFNSNVHERLTPRQDASLQLTQYTHDKNPPQPMKATNLRRRKQTKRQGHNTGTAQQPKKFIWKPGRGAVERIDKYSGEIFHLVEGA